MQKLLIFANCQGEAISKTFNLTAKILGVQCRSTARLNYTEIRENAQAIDEQTETQLQTADFIAWQPLRPKWGKYADIESIYAHKPIESFPYINIDGLWPFYPVGGDFAGSHYLNSKVKQSLSLEDFLSLVSADISTAIESDPGVSAPCNEWDSQERLEKSLQGLADRERYCSVHAYNVLTNRLSEERSMYTQNHPCLPIISHLTARLYENILNTKITADEITAIVQKEYSTDYSIKSFLYGENTPIWPELPGLIAALGFRRSNEGRPEERQIISTYLAIAEAFYAKVVIGLESSKTPHLEPESRMQNPSATAEEASRQHENDFALSGESPHLGGNIQYGDPYSYAPKTLEYLVTRYSIKSAADIGSGEGYQAANLSRLGVYTIAVDGLLANVENAAHPSILHDLTNGPFIAKVDAVFCCEVVEHIEECYLENLLRSLCCGNILIMTHASPGQHGHHHVNEQPAQYWIEHIEKRGFTWSMTETSNLHRVAQSDVLGSNWYGHSGLIFFRNRQR